MLKRIILLLTYQCTLECDHCYLFCSPEARGTMTLSQIREILEEAARIGTVETVSFQGGEPFLFYPLMVEGIEIASAMGYEVWTVTNGYWAASIDHAVALLRPLHELGVNLGVSDDSFHFGKRPVNPAETAVAAAKQLGMHLTVSSIEQPGVGMKGGRTGVSLGAEGDRSRWTAVLRGRAVEKLAEGLPRRPWQEFTECPCPYVGLDSPTTVYVDASSRFPRHMLDRSLDAHYHC